MAYVTIEEANVTTIDQARQSDPGAVVINHRGEDVLTIKDSTTEKYGAKDVGRVFETSDGELWFALDPDYIRESGIVDRARRASDSALRVAGWDI